VASSPVQLSVGDTLQPAPGFIVRSLEVNNQSVGWLTLDGIYVAGPYQQCIVRITPGEPAPKLSLTATPPAGAAGVVTAVGGTCVVILNDQDQGSNPGLVTTNTAVTNNQQVLAQVAAGTTKTIPLPGWVQAVRVTATGNSKQVTVFGNNTGMQYFNVNVGAGNMLDFNVSSVDTALDITVGNTPQPAGAVTFVGLPFSSASATNQLTEIQVVPASGGKIGFTYNFTLSGDDVLATDRALDDWLQSGAQQGVALTLTQPSAVNEALTVTSIEYEMDNPVGAVDNVAVTITGLANAYQGRLSIPATPGAMASERLTNLRWDTPVGDTPIVLLMSAPSSGNTHYTATIAGFTVRSRNI